MAEDVDDASAEIEQILKSASEKLPEGADLEGFEAYLEHGMLPHAWEELRRAAEDHSVPFTFWVEMSRAADLLGGK